MVAWWLCLVAQRRGLEPVLLALGTSLAPSRGVDARGVCHQVPFDGTAPFDEVIARAPASTRCGLRVVVSDLLVEKPPRTLLERLARASTGLAVVQVLGAEELDPSPADGARLSPAPATACQAAPRAKNWGSRERALRGSSPMWACWTSRKMERPS